MSLVSKVEMYWRFGSGIRAFLNHPITVETCKQVVTQRLQERQTELLAMVKTAIYQNQKSPYLRLLHFAGCEYGDFEGMVFSQGIEEALRRLRRAGVYVTLEEFKGKSDIVRGAHSFRVKEEDFDAALRSRVMSGTSGATRSRGTRTSYDFDALRDYAVCRALLLDNSGASHVPLALWWPTLPGGGPKQLLMYTKAGNSPVRWFAQVSKKGSGPSPKDRILTNYIVLMGRLAGKRWPWPDYTPLSQAERVAEWLAQQLTNSGACFLVTYPSSAVRICQAARSKGVDIRGAKFALGGEPYTDAKRKEIESAGAIGFPIYSTTETGMIGQACCVQGTTGDVHLMGDSFALIQHKREVPHSGVSVDAFLLTSLRRSAPKVMLNAENGDYGLVEKSHCGCKLEQLGLGTLISEIRGFDKLTAEGMTLIGTDLVRIVEQVLPARFGGSSTDYQIVEEEDERGRTRMIILASPSLGKIEESQLIEAVLAGLPGTGITASVWSQAGTFGVRRSEPEMTGRGKLLPLHILRRVRSV